MLPSAHDLTYFIEVAATRNISRASERLGITQPSLTLAIQRLEAAVGVPLLVRSKKGVTLTQSGIQLLAHARSLLQQWDQIKTKAVESHERIVGRYTLGCHPSVALYSLSGFVPRAMREHPELELRLVHDLSRKITESVISMHVDLGIVVNPVRHPDLVIRKLCDDEVSLWIGKGSKGIQDPQSGEAVLICDPELLQTQDLIKRLRKSGVRHKRLLPSTNLEVITDLVASGAGMGILPGRVAAKASSRGLTRWKDAPVYRDEICLVYRMENRDVRAIQRLTELVTKSFA